MKTNLDERARSMTPWCLRLGLGTSLAMASCVGTVDLDEGAEADHGEPENGGSTSTSGGSGAPSGDGASAKSDVEVCEAFCVFEEECHGSDPTCVQQCLEFLAGFEDDPTCTEAATETMECYANAMDCEPPDCGLAELALWACLELDDDEGCGISGGGNADGSECFVGRSCPGEPTREVVCTDTACTCHEDFVEVAHCEVEAGACGMLWGEPPGLNYAFIESCCGWTDLEP